MILRTWEVQLLYSKKNTELNFGIIVTLWVFQVSALSRLNKCVPKQTLTLQLQMHYMRKQYCSYSK